MDKNTVEKIDEAYEKESKKYFTPEFNKGEEEPAKQNPLFDDWDDDT